MNKYLYKFSWYTKEKEDEILIYMVLFNIFTKVYWDRKAEYYTIKYNIKKRNATTFQKQSRSECIFFVVFVWNF